MRGGAINVAIGPTGHDEQKMKGAHAAHERDIVAELHRSYQCGIGGIGTQWSYLFCAPFVDVPGVEVLDLEDTLQHTELVAKRNDDSCTHGSEQEYKHGDPQDA